MVVFGGTMLIMLSSNYFLNQVKGYATLLTIGLATGHLMVMPAGE
jgi:hypothetical protein